MTPRHIEHYEQEQLFEEPNAPVFNAAKFREYDADRAYEEGDLKALREIANEGIDRENNLEEKTRDQLTGLPTRWALYNNINESAENATPDKSVLFIDLNGLKGVNDAKEGGGYKIGNEYILANVRGIRANARQDAEEDPSRKADSIFRYGGDELVVVVEGPVTEEDLRNIGERYRTAIIGEVSGTPSLGESFVKRFGAGNSIGVAILMPGETAEELVERAGADQQEQKRLDRNSVNKAVGETATSS